MIAQLLRRGRKHFVHRGHHHVGFLYIRRRREELEGGDIAFESRLINSSAMARVVFIFSHGVLYDLAKSSLSRVC